MTIQEHPIIGGIEIKSWDLNKVEIVIVSGVSSTIDIDDYFLNIKVNNGTYIVTLLPTLQCNMKSIFIYFNSRAVEADKIKIQCVGRDTFPDGTDEYTLNAPRDLIKLRALSNIRRWLIEGEYQFELATLEPRECQPL